MGTDGLGRLIIGTVAALLGLGCASAPPAKLRTPVQRLHGRECPEDRIRVVETRALAEGVVHVVDACGSVVELERGLALPVRRKDVVEVSAETPLEVPASVRRSVRDDVVRIVRQKVQRWCVLGTPDSSGSADSADSADSAGSGDPDQDMVAFYSETPAEQAQCKQRLASGLTPIGTELDPDTNAEAYWFAVGQYVFTVSEAWYEPPCEHRSNPSACTPSPRAADPIPVATESESESETETGAEPRRSARKPKKRWYGHIDLGVGYLDDDTPEQEFSGASWHTHVDVGVKITPDFGLGIVSGTHMGIYSRTGERPYLFGLSLGTVFYPDSESGLQLDAHAGLGTLRHGFTHGGWTSGPLFGAGLGYDFGDRKDGSSDRWTGGSVHVRGTYALVDGSRVAGGALHFGVHSW